MDILIGQSQLILYDVHLYLKQKKVKYYIDHLPRINQFQLSWFSKSGLIKTKIKPYDKFPFVTILNGKEFQSSNIKSLYSLILSQQTNNQQK